MYMDGRICADRVKAVSSKSNIDKSHSKLGGGGAWGRGWVGRAYVDFSYTRGSAREHHRRRCRVISYALLAW